MKLGMKKGSMVLHFGNLRNSAASGFCYSACSEEGTKRVIRKLDVERNMDGC